MLTHCCLGLVDEALGKTNGAASNSAAVIDLSQKRAALEKALLATEEQWLELSSKAEAM